MSTTTVSPIEQLRSATRSIHERIDSGPYASAILDGTLPIPRYASFLRALHALYANLESLVERSGSALLHTAYQHGVERRVRLERDLAHLQTDPCGVDAAVLRALVLAQQTRLDALQADATREAILLGHMYVLEGSQLGGLALNHTLAKRSELAHGGLTYLAGSGRETQPQFRAFLGLLEQHVRTEAAVSAAVTGARHAFEGVAAILDAVMSNAFDGPHLVESINPEAGTHPVARDARELHAALRAGEQSFAAFRYYEARYGERGRSFTRSDSAWLATMARHDGEQALRHVHWLGRVLAARGMPRWLLEQHLELLHKQLVSSVPERAASYDILAHAAAELGAQRKKLVGDAEFEALCVEFNPSAGTEAGISAHEAGRLIVAAVLDEKCGVPLAVESLTAWLGDGARFSESWRAALAQTLTRVRNA